MFPPLRRTIVSFTDEWTSPQVIFYSEERMTGGLHQVKRFRHKSISITPVLTLEFPVFSIAGRYLTGYGYSSTGSDPHKMLQGQAISIFLRAQVRSSSERSAQGFFSKKNGPNLLVFRLSLRRDSWKIADFGARIRGKQHAVRFCLAGCETVLPSTSRIIAGHLQLPRRSRPA